MTEIEKVAMQFQQTEDQYVADLRADFVAGIPQEKIETALREAFANDRGGKGIHPDDFTRIMKRITTGEI
jgi:hypothetical protein